MTPAPQYPLYQKICAICGKPLPPRRRYYCSDACRHERWHRELLKRVEESKGAVGYRPTMWPSIAAEQIILHPTCKRCGGASALEAHHIVALHSDGSNELSNLITLCHTCHRAQHKGKPRKNDISRTIQGAII